MIYFLLGTHIYLTIRSGFVQKKLFQGIKLSVKGGESSYSTIAIALAATIGTGNIIGIASAVAIGGPGSIFWCWITGILGMATCYAESFLSVHYRKWDRQGNSYGGPMYVLKDGMGCKWLGDLFAIFTILVSYGMGSGVQAHAIKTSVIRCSGKLEGVVGIIIALLLGSVILGGAKQITKVCVWLVPLMILIYVGGCFIVLFQDVTVIPCACKLVLEDAFKANAIRGGLIGKTVENGMKIGIARGLFTNEAGLGSIPISAAMAAGTDEREQGYITMTGPFWDTVVLCAISGITTVCSMLRAPGRYVGVAPEELCFVVFEEIPYIGTFFLPIALSLFAFATMVGWNLYGLSAMRYLLGEGKIKCYQIGYVLVAFFATMCSMEFVWGIAEGCNVLMAVPNLLSIYVLQKKIFGKKQAGEGDILAGKC